MVDKDPPAEESDSVEMLSGAESAKLFLKAEVPDSWQGDDLTHAYTTGGPIIIVEGSEDKQDPFPHDKPPPSEGPPDSKIIGE